VPTSMREPTSDAFSKARTGRSAGRAAHQVRIGDQSQDRQDARPRRADDAARMCRRGNRVRRREFITLLGGAMATEMFAAPAQQPGKSPVIGFLSSSSPASRGWSWIS
jgi:hypothetical protein